jgi:putative peptidoglycan lipid II flippase
MKLSGRLNFSSLTAAIGGTTFVLAAGLLLGRVSGVVRELMLAARLGTSAAADYAVVLMSLPDLLANILIAGGLSAVLVPRFKQLDMAAGVKLFWKAFLIILAVFSIIALICFLRPDAVFLIFAPGIPMPRGLLSPESIALIACAIPLSALAGVSGSYLNASQRYLMAGLGTLFFNIAVIAALYSANAAQSIFWYIALGVGAGAMLRLASQLVAMPAIVWKGAPAGTPDIAMPWRSFFAAVAATTLTLIVPNLIRAAASFTGTGAIASLNYAQKLIELPTAVLLSAVTTITLTHVSGVFAKDGIEPARLALSRKLRLSLNLAIFAAAGCLFFTRPIVEFAFGYGAMKAEGIASVGALFQIGSLSLPAIALSLMLSAYLNATNRTSLVLRMTVIAVMTMPALILPGILLNSPVLLVCSMVLFQAILACGLFRVAAKSDGISGSTMMMILLPKATWIVAFKGLAIFALAYAVDRLSALESNLVSLSLMVTAFVAAVLVSSILKDGSD